MAQPFDLRDLKLKGEPRPVADQIAMMVNMPGATFAASPNGVLVWRSGAGVSNSHLQWFDRNGKKLGAVGEDADFTSPALSPDERRLAVGVREPQTKTARDSWVFDLVRGEDAADVRSRRRSEPGLVAGRIPDCVTSDRKGERDIYQKPADGSGQDELLLPGQGRSKRTWRI